MTRVLIGTPTHYCKHYALEEFFSYLLDLTHHSQQAGVELEVVLIDNSPDDGYVTNIRPLIDKWLGERAERGEIRTAVTLSHCPIGDPHPHLPIHQRIATSENMIRSTVLSEGYDYWFTLESDVLPPKEGLVRMLEYLTSEGFDAVQGFYHSAPFSRTQWLKHPDKQGFWLMGFGLISAAILKQVPFRFDEKLPNGYPDAFFGHDMHEKGFTRGFVPDLQAIHLGATVGGQPTRGWHLIANDVALTRAWTAKVRPED